MSELKISSKETITVDIKPGESLLVINKRKKLPPNSPITFHGENVINIATQNVKRVDNYFMSLIKIYLTSLNPIRITGKQCYQVISNYTGLSPQESEFKLKQILSNLSCTDVDTIMKKFPFKLEVYEKQRLMFALAFLIKPKLIILDDTIFKMESSLKTFLLEELNKLKKENKTSIIFISNKFNIVNDGIDLIAIMYKGTIVELGKKDLIIRDPIHPYTRYLLNKKSSLNFSEINEKINNYIENTDHIPKAGCSFCLNCKNACYDCMYMPPKIKTIGKERQVICNAAYKF